LGLASKQVGGLRGVGGPFRTLRSIGESLGKGQHSDIVGLAKNM